MTHRAMFGSALALLAAASLGACAKPAVTPAVDTAQIAEAVKADLHQLVGDFNAHDGQKAVSHDAPDMVGMFHGAPNVIGPDQDLEMTNKQLADNPTANVTVKDETVDVAAAGDMAVYRATYTFSGTDPKTKKPMAEHGNWVVGYKKQADGSWKIAWNVVSDTGAAPPPPAPPASGAPATVFK